MTRRKRRNADALRPGQISTAAAAIRHMLPQQHNHASRGRDCRTNPALRETSCCWASDALHTDSEKGGRERAPCRLCCDTPLSPPSRHLARLQLAELPKPEAPLKWRGSLIFKDQSVTVELHICGACFTIFVLRKDQLGFIAAIIRIIRITIDKNHAIKILLY